MVRLFKHYIPHAVLLLGLVDCVLLFVAAVVRQRRGGAGPLERHDAGEDGFAGLHQVARVDPTTPVIFLNTGKLFGETLRYRDRLQDALGLGDVRSIAPSLGDLLRQVSHTAQGEIEKHLKKALAEQSELCPVLDRCLAKDPLDRPGSQALVDFFDPDAGTAVAWPPPGLERGRGVGARFVAVTAMLGGGLDAAGPAGDTTASATRSGEARDATVAAASDSRA